MAGKFSRFLKLESKRDAAPNEQSGSAPSARFDGLQVSRPEVTSSAGAHQGRIERALEGPLELDARRPVSFVRCARCGVDASAYADECQQCHASLRTAEQQAYNEQLHRKLAEQRRAEELASEGLREQQLRVAEEEARRRRENAEALALEAKKQALARYGGGELLPSLLRRREKWGTDTSALIGAAVFFFVVSMLAAVSRCT